jgi:hypothetical protein
MNNCEYCGRCNRDNSECCNGCGAPLKSMTSMVSGEWVRARILGFSPTITSTCGGNFMSEYDVSQPLWLR